MGRVCTTLAGCAIALSTCGCTGIPSGLAPVTGFEVKRYLGTWYEIARLDHSFERGLVRVSAEYTARDDGGITVVNRGFDPAAKEWREARGVAYASGDPTVGSLEVSFFRPFYGGYHIIALDKEQYAYALVCGPSRSYLWILARTTTLAPPTLGALVDQAKRAGFATDELIYVEHGSD